MLSIIFIVLAVFATGVSSTFAVGGPFRTNYELWCTGNCKVDAVPTSTTPGVVLMGGGVSGIRFIQFVCINGALFLYRKILTRHLCGK